MLHCNFFAVKIVLRQDGCVFSIRYHNNYNSNTNQYNRAGDLKNFGIVKHGKSTLADRLLEVIGTHIDTIGLTLYMCGSY